MRICAAAVALVLASGLASARDEGMWLLEKPPRALLKERHRFEPTDGWLEHVRKSAVRFETGGSGSIVSADGLVMTNHHVGSDMLAALSTKDNDLLAKGFYAPTRDAEVRCPDLEVRVLWTVEDVTDRVKPAGANAPDAAAARRAREGAIAEIEKETQAKTGLTAEVVELYHGGRYHLYGYRRFTDVRLVFAPEGDIAFFGGDTDNFEFPRFDLDCCFFRIYENGAPLQAEHHLAWSSAGSSAGDLALVVGHPGRTERLYTTDHLRYLRDHEIPGRLRWLWRWESKIAEFGARTLENQRISREELLGVTNGRKAYTGQLGGLLDPALFGLKVEDEARVRGAVARDPKLAGAYGDAWDRVRAAYSAYTPWSERRFVIDRALRSDLAQIAIHLVRLAAETPKPNGERLAEYRDSNLPSMENRLYSPAPIHDTLEIAKLESGLSWLAETFGADDPVVARALAGLSPRARAEQAVRGCTLKDPASRRSLRAGGAAAIAASTDPMFALVNALEPEAMSLRHRFESEVEAVQQAEYARIAEARFAIDGDSAYPDATFTLRLSFGRIEGYPEGGSRLTPYTTMGGVFEHAAEGAGLPGFDLPKSWTDARGAIDPSTPMNFVCSADIIGGNSGSPVVNSAGEVIGLIFDGNIHSLPGSFVYDPKLNRAIAVDARAIIESMRKIYGAGALADELTRR